MAEYLIQDTTLTEIADAVRAKTGGAGLLTPDQMATAISNISTGAELNFQVIGGTAQPTNPTENMIWVNTSTEITEWYFSPHQPNSNTEGDLWIKIGSASDAPFNALKENNIIIYPISTKQYIGGTWVDKVVKCYQNGKWASWVIYLFNNGNQFTEKTGGWATLNYYGDGHASIGTNMDFWCTASANPWCWFETNNKIDLTSATWVKALVTASVANDYVLLGITDTFYTSNNIHPKLQTFIAQTVITPTVGATRELAVNVSSLSGEHYVLLKNSACNGSFTKVWIE